MQTISATVAREDVTSSNHHDHSKKKDKRKKASITVLTDVSKGDIEDKYMLNIKLGRGGKLFDQIFTHGELFDRIVACGHYTQCAAAAVAKTIVEVVQLCHKHGVIHRDLKLENFVFAYKKENSPLKAIDFGLSISVP
ncbi:hypothetical protein L1987_13186 [Smallanthus sonchifolius]|uniref:Uncharacterized protein n=1 Tax=Smallanthus sonchifolius TaxID=185202 RepID=A0ACB9JJC1_9ASTR|nr:hypothetical protein L1987_13186 [Smallanthus sonchifolius]